MPQLSRAKLFVGSILSTLLSALPWANQGADAKQAAPSDLRAGGQTSEAAVKAIMAKWSVANERQNEAKERGDKIAQQFVSFRPQFIQSKK